MSNKKTIEEVADRLFPNAEQIGGETYTAYKGFIAAANWQAEQDQKNIDKLISIIQWYDDNGDVRPDEETFAWFEQFKQQDNQ